MEDGTIVPSVKWQGAGRRYLLAKAVAITGRIERTGQWSHPTPGGRVTVPLGNLRPIANPLGDTSWNSL